jgi:hypothetical protein
MTDLISLNDSLKPTVVLAYCDSPDNNQIDREQDIKDFRRQQDNESGQ